MRFRNFCCRCKCRYNADRYCPVSEYSELTHLSRDGFENHTEAGLGIAVVITQAQFKAGHERDSIKQRPLVPAAQQQADTDWYQRPEYN